jgi:hypothetical protein
MTSYASLNVPDSLKIDYDYAAKEQYLGPSGMITSTPTNNYPLSKIFDDIYYKLKEEDNGNMLLR